MNGAGGCRQCIGIAQWPIHRAWAIPEQLDNTIYIHALLSLSLSFCLCECMPLPMALLAYIWPTCTTVNIQFPMLYLWIVIWRERERERESESVYSNCTVRYERCRHATSTMHASNAALEYGCRESERESTQFGTDSERLEVRIKNIALSNNEHMFVVRAYKHIYYCVRDVPSLSISDSLMKNVSGNSFQMFFVIFFGSNCYVSW